jgi:glycosyltransferase involved in cell wall biosynthesis
MKKLLIATDSFLPRWDGIARFLSEIIPQLVNDYDVTIIAPAFEGEYREYEEARVIRFPVTKLKLADYFPAKPSYKKIKQLVREADIVWTQTIGPVGALTIYAASKQKKPLIAYIHSIEWELFTKSLALNRIFESVIYFATKMLAKYLYNKCELLIVPSQETAELFEWNNIKTQKKVVHLGTDASKFVPPKSKEEAKKIIGIEPDKKVIGFCGRIGKEKDLITLYRAFARLQKKHQDSVLLIVGQDLGGVTKGFASKAGVTVIGHTNNVVPYLQAMDIYVLPSLTETSSLSTMEAMACGIVVIATRVGYVKQYIKEGFNGFFFKKRDAYSLYKKMSDVLGNDELLRRVSGNARKTIIEKFSWEKTSRQIKEVIDIF